MITPESIAAAARHVGDAPDLDGRQVAQVARLLAHDDAATDMDRRREERESASIHADSVDEHREAV